MIREANLTDFAAINTLEKQVFDMHFDVRSDVIEKYPFNRDYFEECLLDGSVKIFVFE